MNTVGPSPLDSDELSRLRARVAELELENRKYGLATPVAWNPIRGASNDQLSCLDRSILDALPNAALLLDNSGHVIYANPAALALLPGHMSDPDLHRVADSQVVCPFADEYGKRLDAADMPAARIGRGERLERVPLKYQTAAGALDVLVSGEALPQIPGQLPVRIILVIEDVTAWKATEAELHEAEQDRLKSVQEMQQFAYAAAHDLQEPLRSVSGYLQLVARRCEGKLDADATEYIRFAVDGCSWMGLLIRDLLTYSRAGDPNTLRIEPVAFKDIVQWALMNLAPAVKQTGAVVTQHELPTVAGDQTWLAALMQSLLDNAIKFRSAEPPKIDVSAKREADCWVICVADNGPGFEMKYAERIFGVFKRLHGKQFPGTGIGLAIAKKIVEAHKGKIWAESNPGEGSRFYFSLPAD